MAVVIAITRANQGMRYKMRSWLPTEFGIEKPEQKLAAFATLTQDEFVKEVRQRCPKAAGTLKPAALIALCEGFAEQAQPIQQRQAEAQQLERRLSALVNTAYGLTAADVDLLWRTAPPRMPVSPRM